MLKENSFILKSPKLSEFPKFSFFLLVFVVLTFFVPLCIFAQNQQNEVFYIQNLSNKDENFKQFNLEVENNYKILSRYAMGNDELISSIKFYTYKVKENDTFFFLASRFNVGQETLATINHIASPSEVLIGKTIVVPNCKGLFLSEQTQTAFEILLKQKCADTKPLFVFTVGNENFAFYTDYQVGMTERAFFLDTSLKMPLSNSVLTSEYGMRISPISGKPLFHKGVDLACPEGTEVMACGRGEVVRVGNDSVYGNFIELKHNDGKFSFYAHLSKIEVLKGETVASGKVIGRVGSTGLSTGPHLHFEIRQDNKTLNPLTVVGN